MPGPEQKQRPYLTTLSANEWAPRLVFKELKQHLNLEALNSKDQHAVQVLAWASLIALARLPDGHDVALSSRQPGRARVALPARADEPCASWNHRLLARAIGATARTALTYLELFAEEVLLEIRTRDADCDDSFKRLLPLLVAAA